MKKHHVFGGLRGGITKGLASKATRVARAAVSNELDGMTGPQKLAWMDAKYTMVEMGDKVRVFSWKKSRIYPGALIARFQAPAEVAIILNNQFIIRKNDDGTGTRVALFGFWMRQKTTVRADGWTIDPNGGRIVDGMLNLWCGYGRTPEPGKWPLLRAHIEDVICDGDKVSSDYLLRWLAWTIQHPAEPSEVAVVMRGDKGTGKSILGRLLLSVFGSHGMHISKREHLTGRFNAHLINCCFIFLDEALWPGDKAGEGELKRIVTEPTLTIEPKGIDACEVLNLLSCIMASNEDWVCPASGKERRWAVFNVSAKRAGDFDYFAALMAEIDSGGAEAFMHDMLAVDLGDWHPRLDVPETEGLAMQKRESVRPELQWLWMLLDEGTLPDTLYLDCQNQNVRGTANLAKSRLLWEHCVRSNKSLQFNFSSSKFIKFLEGYGVVKVRRTNANYLGFPPLGEMRAKFVEQNPWLEPFSHDLDQWEGWTSED